MRKGVGKYGEYLGLFSCILNSFGGCVAYLIIIGENFSPIFDRFVGEHFSNAQHTRAYVILLFSILILPLCCMPKVSQLSYSSFFSVCSMLYIVLIVCLFGLLGTVDVMGKKTPSILFSSSDAFQRISLYHEPAGLFSVLPLICFSFQVKTFHFISFHLIIEWGTSRDMLPLLQFMQKCQIAIPKKCIE